MKEKQEKDGEDDEDEDEFDDDEEDADNKSIKKKKLKMSKLASLVCSMKDFINKKAVNGFNSVDFYDEFEKFLTNANGNSWYMFIANGD